MEILKQIVSTTALRVLGACLLFFMHIYFSRSYGADAYGMLSFSIATASLLRLISSHGWPSGLVKLVAVFNKKEQWELFRGVLINSLGHSALLSIIISSVLFLLVHFEFFDEKLNTGLLYTALLLPVLTVTAIRKRFFQALHKPLGSIIPDDVILPIIVCLAIFVTTIDKQFSVFVYISVSAIIMLLSLMWLWSIIPSKVKRVRSKRLTKNWLVVILPMLFGSVGQILLNRTDVIMIGSLLPMENAGIYSAALRIALLTAFVLGSVGMLLAPKLSYSFHLKDKKQFDLYRKQALLFSSAGGLPVFLIIILWPSELMSLFGGQYESYGSILIILAVGQLINALTGVSSFILLMTGHERYFAKTLLLAAVFNLLANYVAIIQWQITGAAVVTVFTISVLNLVQFRKAMSINIA